MNDDYRKGSIFSQAYILGGSPCSGKSTIAGELSARFRLHYYKVDDRSQAHLKQCNPDQHPTMVRLSNMRWNEIWSRPVTLQVKEEFEYYRELFPMIVQDLLQMDLDRPIIVEGAALLPELIHAWHVDRKRALFMVPTKKFQVHHYSQREYIHRILSDCDDPERAFENWMMRDQLFGQEVLHQATAFGFGTIVVDGTRTIEEEIDYVQHYFGLTKTTDVYG